jgi:hypothetical protein
MMADYQAFYEKHMGKIKWGKGGEGLAPCPFHDDRKPSLSVNRDKGVWFCHACNEGGTAQEFARRLGVDSPGRRKQDPEAIYYYHDREGKVVYRMVRGPGKKFWAERPDGKGGWVLGMGEVKPVLYRLPEVLKAEGFVYIVEGEKDVETLRALGLTATTNPFGAGKWKDEFSEYLKGLNVIILPDNDEPGRKHAQEVHASLYGKANGALIVDLPGLAEKEDVTDWLAKGHTVDELRALVAKEWDRASAEGRLKPSVAISVPSVEAPDASTASADNLKPWPKMDDKAYYGTFGLIVRAIDPYTQADPVAVLVHLLTGFGNAVGLRPHFIAEETRHSPRLYAVLAGSTGRGRKGTALQRAMSALREADPDWADGNTLSGLSTGEGLIYQVRDPTKKKIPARNKEKDASIQTDEVVEDPGVEDKRLFIIETEFGGPLAVMEREGNTLITVLRNAWDGRTLRTATKTSPLRATGAHISLIGHITPTELLGRLSEMQMANGFANRVLWFLVRQSKLLPDGGLLPESERTRLGHLLSVALEKARQIDRMGRNPVAEEIWKEVYPDLSSDRPGLTEAILSRAEAQVLRLSMLYALGDGTASISGEHLEAALAVFRYSRDSVQHIFSGMTGDPVADRILRELSDGDLTDMEIYNLFGRNVKASRLEQAKELLRRLGLAIPRKGSGKGRPPTVWSRAGNRG